MSDDSIIFKYELLDAWANLISSVQVFDEKKLVQFCSQQEDERHQYAVNRISIDTLPISSSVLESIKHILNDKRLYDLENELEKPVVLDGYVNRFFFSNGERSVELFGLNMAVCQLEPESYPNVMLVVKTLGKIATLLIQEGVEEQCFWLARIEDLLSPF